MCVLSTVPGARLFWPGGGMSRKSNTSAGRRSGSYAARVPVADSTAGAVNEAQLGAVGGCVSVDPSPKFALGPRKLRVPGVATAALRALAEPGRQTARRIGALVGGRGESAWPSQGGVRRGDGAPLVALCAVTTMALPGRCFCTSGKTSSSGSVGSAASVGNFVIRVSTTSIAAVDVGGGPRMLLSERTSCKSA